MQDQIAFNDANCDAIKQKVSASQKKHRNKGGLQHFIYWNQEDQLRAFLNWLPEELHNIPGIDWATLAPEIMGYFLRQHENSLDTATLVVAVASIHRVIDVTSQITEIKHLSRLLRSLRATTPMQCIDDLRQEQIWFSWAAAQVMKESVRLDLAGYTSIAAKHFPHYLRRLTPPEQERMKRYALPLPPSTLARDYFPFKLLRAKQQKERKATTDILVPLYPILRQIVRLRKQLAERTLLAIREARRKVESGEASLPYHFQHVDVVSEMNRNARTVSEVCLEGREVTMKLTLWDKRSWVIAHPERYSDTVIEFAQYHIDAYTDKQNRFFVQFDNAASDILWFGDLVERRVFKTFTKWDTTHSSEPEDYQPRWKYARECGFSHGCVCGPEGLLSSGDYWLAKQAERSKELLLDFESLYRGVLYGSTLAMIALSNGSRMNELLQVSMNKERRITRTETVFLLGEDGLPQLGEAGQPLTKEVKLHFQHLLPKGAKVEEERQLFPLSKEALRLLEEIRHELVARHGEVPMVAPSRSNSKREHLKPERYLFQWNALAGESPGTISANDAQTLLRFILHGLDLYTAQGKPIRIVVHILRHVMSTHARHYRQVPPEVIAHFFLHHRLRELTGRTPSLPEATEYYTMMTEEQRFAVIRADLDEQEEIDHMLLATIPKVVDLEQKNEAIQIAYELWHALHPTAFGYCACPGLCPRERDRSLCLGCSYLVEDPEKLGAARAWRTDYARQAALFEAQGNAADARQARIKVQLLDDMINVMRMQLEEETGGRYIPVFKVLPSPYRQLEAGNETEDEA